MFTSFERQVMTGAINKRPVFPGLWKELFFKRRHPFAGTTIEMHTTVAGKKLLPFVAEGAPGTVEPNLGREAQVVKCSRLRHKKQFSAKNLIKFTNPGEPPVLAQDITELDLEAGVAADLQDLKDRAELTIEYMAGQAVCGGMLTVVQPDIEFTIDYRMPAAHKITLTGDDMWSADGVNPLENLQTFADLIQEACGLTPDVVVQGTNAWQAFRNNAAVQAELDTRRIDHPGLSPRVGNAYQGSVGGQKIYRYGGTYWDGAGASQYILHPDYILVGCTEAETSIEFGLPEDLEAGGRPMEYFSKSKIEWDPSVMWILSETRPLPYPKQIGAFAYVRVVNSG